MKGAVLNIGDEVLLGHTINTNLALISKKCQDHGISIEEQITIRDDRETIIKTFLYLLDKYNMVITSGGLGPTEDDITAKSIGEALGRDMILDENTLKNLKSYFAESGRKMTENNISQAYFPENANILKNDVGTASGFYINKDGKWILVLPGPPREVENIIDKFFKVYGSGKRIIQRTINTQGIGESALEERLRKLYIDPEYTVNTYFGSGGVDIKIVSEFDDYEKLERLIDRIVDEFRENVFDFDSESISKSLLKKLLAKNKTIAFAESITGGKLASNFVENEDASLALICSLVTYSNEAKMKELNVKKETLDKYTAVSEEVAREMLEGLKNKYVADYYGITTGYASPTGDKEKDGIVYTGIYDRERDKEIILRQRFYGSRVQIIDRVTNNLYYNIIKLIDGGGLYD